MSNVDECRSCGKSSPGVHTCTKNLVRGLERLVELAQDGDISVSWNHVTGWEVTFRRGKSKRLFAMAQRHGEAVWKLLALVEQVYGSDRVSTSEA